MQTQLKPIVFRVSRAEHEAIKSFCRRNGESDISKFFRRICREQIPGVAQAANARTEEPAQAL